MAFNTAYIANTEINELQRNIMLFVSLWVKSHKTPVPQKEIVAAMKENGIKECTTLNAINSLKGKGFIRKSAGYASRFTEYTQLRTV